MICERAKREMISLAVMAALFFTSIAIVDSLALEYDTNRPGMDYSNFDLPSADPSLCEQACNSDPICQAFTYVKPGVMGDSAICWLKNGIPAANPDTCCDSGIKGATFGEMKPTQSEQFDNRLDFGVIGTTPGEMKPIQNEQFDNKILLSKVPLNIHRRAAQLLEEMRGSPMAPGWENAILSEAVVPFYRPDMDGIAYYEFKVEPKGFLILSATENDFPVAHWSSEDDTISTQLANEAEKSGKSVGKFLKLDTLSYAVEDPNGELAASLGDMPNKIIVLDPAAIDDTRVNTVSIPPSLEGVSSGKVEGVDGTGDLTEQGPFPVEFQPWDSWSELKQGYAGIFDPQLKALHQEAAMEWEKLTKLETEGEGLVPGDTRNIVLLYKNAKYNLKGEGQNFASVNLIQKPGLPDVLEVTASSIPPEGMAELDILISYEEVGQQENIKFAILDPNRVQPRDEFFERTLTTEIDSDKLKIQGDWGPYHWFKTGMRDDQTHDYQRLYNQIPAGSCPSGCGPTAWAMLLGWADHQARIGNPVWRNHWGIYRENGGYGADADAPRLQDAGIDAITREIRRYVGTYCLGSQGATNPWDMDEVIQYRNRRDGFGLVTDWSPGIPLPGLSSAAKEEIVYRRNPVIIGTGFLSHYPLAYIYIWCERTNWYGGRDYTQYFYVNQGWGGSQNGWISCSTWFMGRLWI